MGRPSTAPALVPEASGHPTVSTATTHGLICSPLTLPVPQPHPGLPSPPTAEARSTSGGGLSGEQCQPRRPPGCSSWEARRGWGGRDPSLAGPHSRQVLMWACSAGGPRGDLGRGHAPTQGPASTRSPLPWLPPGLAGSGVASLKCGEGIGTGGTGAWPCHRGLTPRAPQAARRAPAFSPTSPSRTRQCRVSAPAPLCSGSG